MIEDLNTDFEKAQYLQNLIISFCTGGTATTEEYVALRCLFLDNPHTKDLVPVFVRTNRDLSQFWQFIKFKFAHYAERRAFIWQEFTPLLEFLEKGGTPPSAKHISDILEKFNSEHVHGAWIKALDRTNTDPDGAITAARTLLETVCKHLLDEMSFDYGKNPNLTELYSHVAKNLNLSPTQHAEKTFRQILGGCSSVVDGLGSLRNKIGDAHGQGKTTARPLPRHAALAVNLSGAMAMFLVETWEKRKDDPTRGPSLS